MTGLWEGLELGRSVRVKSRPGLEENDFLLEQWGVWEGVLNWEVASSYLYVGIAVGQDKLGGL